MALREMNPLDEEQIKRFIEDGFVCIPQAFTNETMEKCLNVLWKDTGCDPNNRMTWTKPVIRLGNYTQTPFVDAVNTPILQAAYHQLAGKNRWKPRFSLGTFPIRFPHPTDPGDTGWHVDASFSDQKSDDFLQWHINVFSEGRALLMLFIFSDVGEDDAPSRIRVGSHLDVARILHPFGARGLSFMELTEKLSVTDHRKEVLATGLGGTVYLCHPFLVHAAQCHLGESPKFMAQPPLELISPLILERVNRDYSPVELAVRLALSMK